MQGKRALEGKRILIADDEPDVLETLEGLLTMCAVVNASNFADGKGLWESQPSDMAILDYMGVDGYKLLKLATQRDAIAVILFLTRICLPSL